MYRSPHHERLRGRSNCDVVLRFFFFFLSLLFRYNWAAMTAAFPPNGKGQINLPVLMSANGTGSSAATWKINQPAESARVCVSTCVCVRMVRSKSCNDLRNYNICRFDARWSFGNQSSSRFMVNIEGTSIRTRSAPFVQVWHETLKWILVTERRFCGFSHLVLFTKMGFQFFSVMFTRKEFLQTLVVLKESGYDQIDFVNLVI